MAAPLPADSTAIERGLMFSFVAFAQRAGQNVVGLFADRTGR